MVALEPLIQNCISRGSDSVFTPSSETISTSYWLSAVIRQHFSSGFYTYSYLNQPASKHIYSTSVYASLSGFYSLRCVKSAASWLNMSAIPNTERGAFKSTSASAENLQTNRTMQLFMSPKATVTGVCVCVCLGLTLGWAGGLSSCAWAWSSSAQWLCWCVEWCWTEARHQPERRSACWWCCHGKAAQSPGIWPPEEWWPCLRT